MDHAELVVLQRFVRQIKSEFTGPLASLAEQALQEAKLASDEAERRYAPDAPHPRHTERRTSSMQLTAVPDNRRRRRSHG